MQIAQDFIEKARKNGNHSQVDLSAQKWAVILAWITELYPDRTPDPFHPEFMVELLARQGVPSRDG